MLVSGVGSDLKISKTQIRKILKAGHGAPEIGIKDGTPRTKPRSRRSTTSTNNRPTTKNTTTKDDDKLTINPTTYRPPPFIGSWDDYNKFLKTGGLVLPKKDFKTKKKVRKPKFHKKIPMTNYDLVNWCSFLNIPIKDVLSRGESVLHNHKLVLLIYNLEPSYMSGRYWVATYIKDNVINYFDSFGMAPFQEIANHAKRKNLTLLHQSDQIQNIKTLKLLIIVISNFQYHKNSITKSRNDNININVFEYEDKQPFPIYISKEKFEDHMNL